jgi:hypothetical protein
MYLKNLGLSGEAESYERKKLFERQLHYLFGSNSDIRTGMEGLTGALDEYEKTYKLIENIDNNVDSVKSDKLLQLNYSVRTECSIPIPFQN